MKSRSDKNLRIWKTIKNRDKSEMKRKHRQFQAEGKKYKNRRRKQKKNKKGKRSQSLDKKVEYKRRKA